MGTHLRSTPGFHVCRLWLDPHATRVVTRRWPRNRAAMCSLRCAATCRCATAGRGWTPPYRKEPLNGGAFTHRWTRASVRGSAVAPSLSLLAPQSGCALSCGTEKREAGEKNELCSRARQLDGFDQPEMTRSRPMRMNGR
jgi:hypothetical protein